MREASFMQGRSRIEGLEGGAWARALAAQGEEGSRRLIAVVRAQHNFREAGNT